MAGRLSTPYGEQNTLLLGVGAVRQYGVPSFNPLWGTALIVALTDMGNGFTGMLLIPLRGIMLIAAGSLFLRLPGGRTFNPLRGVVLIAAYNQLYDRRFSASFNPLRGVVLIAASFRRIFHVKLTFNPLRGIISFVVSARAFSYLPFNPLRGTTPFATARFSPVLCGISRF